MLTINRLISGNNKDYVTTSLEGCTKRSGRNRGRSPRHVDAKRLPGRQYLVLGTDTARYCLPDSCPVPCNPGLCPGFFAFGSDRKRNPTASLSTAFQAGHCIHNLFKRKLNCCYTILYSRHFCLTATFWSEKGLSFSKANHYKMLRVFARQ